MKTLRLMTNMISKGEEPITGHHRSNVNAKGHVLVITEKPEAARRIACALDEKGTPQKKIDYGMPYYIAKRSREIVVAPALGHLYTVSAQSNRERSYPIFDFEWVPRHVVEKKARMTSIWLEAISRLARNADTFVDACDYDIEGSIIGYNILKYACKGKEQQAKRMKYSTLTEAEIRAAYTHLLPHLDFALIEAGRTRHEVDWLFGINLSRALTTAAKCYSKSYTMLSTGRVQGPTLKFVIAREKAIKSFIPTPYWTIKAIVQIDGQDFEAQCEEKIIETKGEADAIAKAASGKEGTVEKVDEREFQQQPPVPFDLGTLQNEVYRVFGYAPKRTLFIAQNLYLDALISYPRTSSQKLPLAINPHQILSDLSKVPKYRLLAENLLTKPTLKPNEGNKEDPAHPAIYPTGKLPHTVLNSSERNLWDLIVRRFMAVFANPATKQVTKITINISGHNFQIVAVKTLKKGWLHFYEPYARTQGEISLPTAKEGQHVTGKKIILSDNFTTPPPRYNPSTLLNKMEKAGIGTKTTRANIIQTLYERNYIKNEKITATSLGFDIVSVLEQSCPKIVSTEFTKSLEREMDDIQTGCRKREEILTESVEMLKSSLKRLKENEDNVGEQLSQTIQKLKIEGKIIGVCPSCGTGKLLILRSRKTRKLFVGCTNYFKKQCNTSFSLPQKGNAKPYYRTCTKCGWPLVKIIYKGKPPWIFCFNPQCPLKKESKETA